MFARPRVAKRRIGLQLLAYGAQRLDPTLSLGSPVAIPAHRQVSEPLQTLTPALTPNKSVPVVLIVMTLSR